MKPTLLATALLVLLPASAGAQDAQHARVRYADLDLASDAGVKVFDRRLAAAAAAVCPDANGLFDLARQALARRCSAMTMKQLAPARARILAAHAPAWKVAEGRR